MKWTQLLGMLENLQECTEAMPGQDSNVAHYAYTRLNRALAEANEILEAFAQDEEKP